MLSEDQIDSILEQHRNQFEELTVEQILTRAVGVECRRCHVFLICDIDQDLYDMMDEHVKKCEP